VLVGDAFGSLAVPWHLATREFLEDVRRVLKPDGLVALNLIDRGPLRFARAEVATLLRVFRHVAVVGDTREGGNLILLASQRPDPDPGAVAHRERGGAHRRGAAPLRRRRRGPDDAHAPVDQLLTPRRTGS
jgi:hypothetical protein